VRRALRKSHGQTLVLVSLLMIALMGAAALAVDVGDAYIYKERCEFALEAAVLAAAGQLPVASNALAAAQACISANKLDPALLQMVTPVDGNDMKVTLTYASGRPTVFSRVLGTTSLNYVSAVTAERLPPALFDYALFSSSTLEDLRISGASLDVVGSVHSNEDLRFNGATINVSDRLDAVGTLINNGSTINAGLIELGMPVIRMPMYSVSDLRAMCLTRYDGSQHWSGTTINVDGGLFVDGDLTLTGVTIQGQGMIVATGNIYVHGTQMHYESADDAVCLYANKDIEVQGVDMVVQGNLYAPNGEVGIGGTNVRIEGAVAGDTIDFFGTSPTIVHTSQAGSVMPGIHARLVR